MSSLSRMRRDGRAPDGWSEAPGQCLGYLWADPECDWSPVSAGCCKLQRIRLPGRCPSPTMFPIGASTLSLVKQVRWPPWTPQGSPVCPHHPTCGCRQSRSGADEASPRVVTAGLAQLSKVQRSSMVCSRGMEHCPRLLQVGKVCMDATWWDLLSRLETTPADGTAPLGSVEGRKEERSEGPGAWSTNPSDYWPVCPRPSWLLDPQGQHCPQEALAETEVHRPHSSGVRGSSGDGIVDLCAAEVQEHTARPSWAPLRPWGPGPISSASASGSPHTSQSRAVDCGYPGAASSSPSSTFQYSWPRKK